VPTINSFIILAPIVIEYFTFGQSLRTIQYAAAAVIIAGVILLTATEKADRIEGVPKKV
jgi:multidrug transporter EmrE-like cation transporter